MSLFPCASRLQTALARMSHNPLQHNKTHRCRHLSADQKGIYAPALLPRLSLVSDRSSREGQALGETEALANGTCGMHRIDRQKDPGWVGVAGSNPAQPIPDLKAVFRASTGGNLDRPVLEKFGPAQNHPPRLGGGSGARCASCPQPWPSPALGLTGGPFLSHGGACRHE
jgi:hypothetical protein